MNEQQRYELARDRGMAARRAGRRQDANPYKGDSQEQRNLAEYWELGYEAEDASRNAA